MSYFFIILIVTVFIIYELKNSKNTKTVDEYELLEEFYSNSNFNTSLGSMFMSLEEKQKYIQSDKWKILKEKRLKIANRSCEICKRKNNLQLHHITYERLGDEIIEDLIILCKKCHQQQHDIYGYDRITLYLPLIT